MAKMYALKTILRTVEGKEELIEPRTVFDAAPAQAKQLMALQSARNALPEEVKAAADAQAKADGVFYG